MSWGAGFVKLLAGIVIATIFALLVIAFLDSLLQTGLGPEPGDPLYRAFSANIQMTADILPLMVGGLGAVLVFIVARIRSGF